MKLHRFRLEDFGSVTIKFAILLALVAVVGLTAYASVQASPPSAF
jgi:Flp pilus assembly pilin Flp